MTAVATQNENPTAVLEKVVIGGDLSALKPAERLLYYADVCKSVGLNPLTQPFEYINLNGKLRLYAKRDCTDQLRKIHAVSVRIVGRDLIGDIYVVTAQAKDKHGREDESTGAVNIHGKNNDDLANAYMKAETKAKRRVTLSICGLGLLDESEVADIDPDTAAPETERPVVRMPQAKIEAPAEVDTSKKIAPAQVKVLTKSLERSKVTADAFCKHFELAALADLPFVKINEALKWITDQAAE
jgi:hypothetical protein